MRYGSICSGIEAASVAWHELGWHPVFFAEIEPFCNAVLHHHYPDVPNVGDFTQLGDAYAGTIDLLIGGTPCQSFSVAGGRAGLDDPRGHLTLEYFALLDRLRPTWMVWENVPGVLSDDGGRTFGTVLGLLGQLGYGFAYRVLDAQYFGVPQRRRRVFLVGYRGDWRPSAAVLFERQSLQGDSPPRRETGQRLAETLTRGADSQGYGGYAGRRREDDVNLVCGPLNTRHTPNGHGMRGANQQDAFDGHIVFDVYNQTIDRNVSHTLCALTDTCTQRDYRDGHHAGLAVHISGRARVEGRTFEMLEEQSYALCNPGSGGRAQSRQIAVGTSIRRLTPRECERLQGFPDDYTLIPWRLWQHCQKQGWSYEAELHKRGMRLREPSTEECPDSPRYRALGNSFAVPVVRWLGERIQQVEAIIAQE